MESSKHTRRLTQQEATELFMKYYGYVRGVAFASIPLPSLSEDVAHDVYICFVENATKWNYREEKVKPLLKSITRNMAARIWKKQMRQTSGALTKVAEFLQKELANDEEFLSSYLSLEDKIEALRLCLTKMNPDSRTLIENIYFEERTYSELAKQRKKTAEALYMQASRARTQLHECVTKELESER